MNKFYIKRATKIGAKHVWLIIKASNGEIVCMSNYYSIMKRDLPTYENGARIIPNNKAWQPGGFHYVRYL